MMMMMSAGKHVYLCDYLRLEEFKDQMDCRISIQLNSVWNLLTDLLLLSWSNLGVWLYLLQITVAL